VYSKFHNFSRILTLSECTLSLQTLYLSSSICHVRCWQSVRLTLRSWQQPPFSGWTCLFAESQLLPKLQNCRLIEFCSSSAILYATKYFITAFEQTQNQRGRLLTRARERRESPEKAKVWNESLESRPNIFGLFIVVAVVVEPFCLVVKLIFNLILNK